ncbi:hypothetical protein MNBD_GAMMA09-303 [hydrothermal vent metagenome]|uniref:Disease resistance R13L4/SHOC-2-like LRR domain-containing protein n=1 Tax=hydrothermal vent metagenome TaxID=652676 RepID=A0A3B0XD18_9ZZZZ
MKSDTIFNQLFSSDTNSQIDALKQITQQIVDCPNEIDIPALVVFAFAQPFLSYKDHVNQIMHDMIYDKTYIANYEEREDALYRMSDVCESARTLIEMLPKQPKKLGYRDNQEYMRYVCENGQSRVIEKLIARTCSEDGVSLHWEGSRLRQIPHEFKLFPTIKNIEFHTAYLKEFPEVLLEMVQLENITIYSSKIKQIPEGIKSLKNLKKLNLTRNQLESLPQEIGELENLQELDLSRNKLTELPASLAKLSKLKTVYLNNNPMTSAVQVKKLFLLFHKHGFTYKNRALCLHLIFARIQQAIELNNLSGLIEVLNMPLSLLQDNALLALNQVCNEDLKETPLKSGSVIRVYGELLDMDSLADELDEQGISISADYDVSCTHVLIGIKPGQGVDLSVPIITQQMLQKYLLGEEGRFFDNETQGVVDSRQKLNELLLSEDSRNQLLAFEMIKSFGMSKSIIENVYFIYRTSSDKKIKETTKQLLLNVASDEFVQIINKNQSYNNASEPGFNRYLNELRNVEGVDELYLSMIIFRRLGMGINFIFENGSSDDKRFVIGEIIENHGYLNMRYSHLKQLPEEVGEFTGIEKADLCGNQLKELPDSFGNLINLKILLLYENKLSSVPDSFSNLKNIEYLDIRLNRLKKFPHQLQALSHLDVLRISSNSIKELPEGISNLSRLKELEFGGGVLEKIPSALYSLKSLSKLTISSNSLEAVEDEISSLQQLQELKLSFCGLTEFPLSICSLQNLQLLDIDYNKIETIPDEISRLINLKYLNLASNKLTELPLSVCGVDALQGLNISFNEIDKVPEALSDMKNLQQINTGYYGFGEHKLIDLINEYAPQGCKVE